MGVGWRVDDANVTAVTAGTGEHAPSTSLWILLGVGVEVEQDARGDTLVLARQREQKVLGVRCSYGRGSTLRQRQLQHPSLARGVNGSGRT